MTLGMQHPYDLPFEWIEFTGTLGRLSLLILLLIEPFFNRPIIKVEFSCNLAAFKAVLIVVDFYFHKGFIIDHGVPSLAILKMSPRQSALSMFERGAGFSPVGRSKANTW